MDINKTKVSAVHYYDFIDTFFTARMGTKLYSEKTSIDKIYANSDSDSGSDSEEEKVKKKSSKKRSSNIKICQEISEVTLYKMSQEYDKKFDDLKKEYMESLAKKISKKPEEIFDHLVEILSHMT